MESKVKLLGHPIHPLLIVLPLGLFIGAVVFDALCLWRGNPLLGIVGYWNIAGGITGGSRRPRSLSHAVTRYVPSWRAAQSTEPVAISRQPWRRPPQP